MRQKRKVTEKNKTRKTTKRKKVTAKGNTKLTKAKGKRTSLMRTITDATPFFKSRSLDMLPALAKAEQLVGESKFFISPAYVPPKEQEDNLYELPAGYGDNRIVIQVRDPYWIHSYWEIAQEKLNLLRREFGDILNDAKYMLRVYDITGVMFNGTNANRFFDIEINDYANNWYINVSSAGRTYCVDIGLLLPDNKFITLARSNLVHTPIDGPSWITDEEWMIVEEDFNRLYGLSVGLGVDLSSAQIRKQIKKRLKSQLSSGALFSPSSPRGKKVSQRNFWLVVNTELIVYGATEPDAKVSVQGKPIKLNKDGTFSLRFALPDGEQIIPVRAQSADKVEVREITPVVKKKTV